MEQAESPERRRVRLEETVAYHERHGRVALAEGRHDDFRYHVARIAMARMYLHRARLQ
ncbi:MAG TPA: hypothetical protein VFX21_04320 [Acidimicrobiia bacterium]|nr:hypothetical protein [Acidimicrobiia bacterium]